MKRIVLEWGLLFSISAAVALCSLWVVSRFFDSTTYCLELRSLDSARGRDELFLLVFDGNLSLSNGIEQDRRGNTRPSIVGPPSASDLLRGDRIGEFTVPGLELHYYYLARWGGSWCWSLRLSLLIPAAFTSLVPLLLYRRLHYQHKGALAPLEPHLS